MLRKLEHGVQFQGNVDSISPIFWEIIAARLSSDQMSSIGHTSVELHCKNHEQFDNIITICSLQSFNWKLSKSQIIIVNGT